MICSTMAPSAPAARLSISAVTLLVVAALVGVIGPTSTTAAATRGTVRNRQASSSASSSTGFSVLAYDVDLQIDLTSTTDFTFDVKTRATIQATEDTDAIAFNFKNIDVSQKVTVDGKDKNGTPVRVPVVSVNLDTANETVSIYLQRPLAAGSQYDVTMQSTGLEQSASSEGLVRFYYHDQQASSFTSAIRTAAQSGRRVFPCVDEPAAVADIRLHVRRPSSHRAVANGRLSSSEGISALAVKDTFESVRLSPSQLGLVVLPQASAADDDTFPAYGRAQVSNGLSAVAAALSTLSEVVANVSGLPLALQHLAVVALPGVSGVAPSAGLLPLDEDSVLGLLDGSPTTARRDALLHLAEAAGRPAVRAAARPRRWADAWAAHSLAAHLRHRYADKAFADWRMGEQQMALQLQDVLEEGGQATDRALPDAGSGVTHISRAAVDKGAVLVRMLDYFLEEEVFDPAVKQYYEKSSAAGVLEIDDLYDAFAEEVYNEGSTSLPTTVPIVLESWTSKPGYPVVTVIRDYENSKMTVSQKKFSWGGSGGSRGGAADEWWIPLTYTSASSTDSVPLVYDWMAPGENDVELDTPRISSFDWIYLNLEQKAPYRVNYDVNNWHWLTKELQGTDFNKRLRPAARAHLLGDALALARAGELDYAVALNLAVYLKQEDDLLPWLVARRALAFLDDRLGGLAEGSLARPLAAFLLRPLYLDAQFGVGGDPATPYAALLRELVVTWACHAGLADCLDHASGLYQAWRHDNRPPQPDFVEATLCAGMSRSPDDAVPFLLELLGRADVVGGLRLSAIRAVGCTVRADLLHKLVEAAMDSAGPFLASEVVELMKAVTQTGLRPGGKLIYPYLNSSHGELVARVGSPEDIKSLVFHLASKVSTEGDLLELVSAIGGLGDDGAVRQVCGPQLEWMERNEHGVADWISVYLDIPSDTTSTPGPQTSTTPSSKPPSTPGPQTSTTMRTRAPITNPVTRITERPLPSTTHTPASASWQRPAASVIVALAMVASLVPALRQ